MTKYVVIVCIAGVPSPPRGPLRTVDANVSSLTIMWDHPESDGGSEITDYVIEICMRGEDWKILTKVRHLFIKYNNMLGIF